MYRFFYYFNDIHDNNCESYEVVEFSTNSLKKCILDVSEAIYALSELNENLIKRIEIIFVPNGELL